MRRLLAEIIEFSPAALPWAGLSPMAASGAGLFTAGLFLSDLVRAGLGSAARGLFKMEPLRLGLASTAQVQLLSRLYINSVFAPKY